MPSKRFLLIGGFVALNLVLAGLKLTAAATLPILADEPEDLFLMQHDLRSQGDVFGYEFSAVEQARLPLVLGNLVAAGLDGSPLLPLRLLSLLFLAGYLVVSFKLVLEVFEDRTLAWLYVLLLNASCYFASFTIFATTTGNTAYLFFHAFAILAFVRAGKAADSGQAFGSVAGLGALIGACTAGKLFGALLIPAFAAHQLWHRRTTVLTAIPVPGLLALGLGYLAVLAALALAPLPSAVQLWGLALGSLGYVAALMGLGRAERVAVARPTGFGMLWAALCVTAFAVFLLLSPIHLDLANVLGIFGWFAQWNRGAVVASSSPVDIPVIIVLKYGLVSLLALVACGVAIFRHRRSAAQLDSTRWGSLFLLVFGVHFLAITFQDAKVTWYPVAIFPFLYLPFLYLLQIARTDGSRRLLGFGVVLCIVVLVDNGTRYAAWYPYGHFDGAQYGRQHIGWNKSALVTFEASPALHRHLSLYVERAAPRTVHVAYAASAVPRFQGYGGAKMARELRRSLQTNFRLTPGFDEADLSELVVSSPVYNPELEARLPEAGYTLREILEVKSIPVVSLWEKR